MLHKGTARLRSALVLGAVLAAPGLPAQDGGDDRIEFSRPTDKINQVPEEERRIPRDERGGGLLTGSGLGEAAAGPTPAPAPALSRDTLRRLQAERDWALQDLPGGADELEADPTRMSVDDLFDKRDQAEKSGRREVRPDEPRMERRDNSGAQDSIFSGRSEHAPRHPDILNGGSIFDKQRRTRGGQADDGGLAVGEGAQRKSAAELRSEERARNFRELLNRSVFDPGTRTEHSPLEQGFGVPGLNRDLAVPGARRTGPAPIGTPEAPRQEDRQLADGTRPVEPLRGLRGLPDAGGREAGGLYERPDNALEFRPNGTPTVQIPSYKPPRRNF